MRVFIYVEGGGETRALRAQCREAFSRFLERAGLHGRMPAVIACGSRNAAFDKFRTAMGHEEDILPLLLVDSESTVAGTAAWTHLSKQDRWKKPKGASDDQAHLMVRCMEAWFLADRESLAKFFGAGFGRKSLPKSKDVETIDKAVLLTGLRAASAKTRKGSYDKRRHSFEILGELDPRLIAVGSAHARRLLSVLNEKCG